MGEFLMPSLGADMTEGTVVDWQVAPGDRVHKGDVVAVVDTDKADIDVEVFEDGVVEALLVPVGERVPVGTPLARLTAVDRSGAAPVEPEPPPAEPEPAPPEPALAEPERAPPPPASPRDGARTATAPLDAVLQRLARHRGVDLDTVRGTGVDGRITRADIDAAAADGEPSRPAATAAPLRGADRAVAMREAIARLMLRSKREIPHYYVGTDIDLSNALAWLEAVNRSRPVAARLLPAAVLLKAAALAAREVPEVNGFWVDETYQPADHVHLGVAISLRGGGLIAPALRDADRRSVADVMEALRDLVQRTRAGRLTSSEMTDATLTVTSLGDTGVDTVYGVIYPPQVALVGLGRVVDRPWADGATLDVRPVVRATLAADHRAGDGLVGARYLTTLDRLLQAPEEL